MSSDQATHERLESVLAKIKHLNAKKQQAEGRMQEALSRKKQIEDECRALKVDPENLPQIIEGLRKAYVDAVSEMEIKVAEADEALSKFQE